MKKITAIALLSIALVSCKKETAKITKVDEKTGKVITVEVPKDSVKEIKANPAIKDTLGVFRQSFKLEKGKTYPFKTVQRENMKMTAPNGQSQSGTKESVDDVTFTVDNFANKVYDITINFVKKVESQTVEGKTISIDTSKPEPAEQQLKGQWKMQKALTGNSLKMQMDENGKILSIKGFEPIYAKVSKTVASLTKEKKAIEGMTANVKAGFNEESLKEQFSKNFMLLPEKGAKIGEKWTKSENMSADGKVKLNTTYTLQSVGNGEAIISVNGGIPYKSEKQNQGNMTHSMSSELAQNGKIIFDQNTGWIKTQNISVKTTQKETLSDGKQTQSMTSVNNTSLMINSDK